MRCGRVSIHLGEGIDFRKERAHLARGVDGVKVEHDAEADEGARGDERNHREVKRRVLAPCAGRPRQRLARAPARPSCQRSWEGGGSTIRGAEAPTEALSDASVGARPQVGRRNQPILKNRLLFLNPISELSADS